MGDVANAGAILEYDGSGKQMAESHVDPGGVNGHSRATLVTGRTPEQVPLLVRLMLGELSKKEEVKH
jgi:hypothetical protein